MKDSELPAFTLESLLLLLGNIVSHLHLDASMDSEHFPKNSSFKS